MMATYFYHAVFLLLRFNRDLDKPVEVYFFLITYLIVYLSYIGLARVAEYRVKLNYCIIQREKKVILIPNIYSKEKT